MTAVDLDVMRHRNDPDAIVSVRDLSVVFGAGSRRHEALRSVSFDISRGQSLGLVGESGSGKSTLAKTMVGINRIAAGSITIDGRPVGARHAAPREERKRLVQMIPQDPYSSLDPRQTVGQVLAEALDPIGANVRQHRTQILSWLDRVRLPASAAEKYPHEFSGGQRQRIAIARALCVEPRLVIADEITSALDLSVQAEILELLADLRREVEFTMLFISHNLAVVRQVCDDVLVLYLGEALELGPVDEVFHSPRSAYTQKLLAAMPGSPTFRIRG